MGVECSGGWTPAGNPHFDSVEAFSNALTCQSSLIKPCCVCSRSQLAALLQPTNTLATVVGGSDFSRGGILHRLVGGEMSTWMKGRRAARCDT